MKTPSPLSAPVAALTLAFAALGSVHSVAFAADAPKKEAASPAAPEQAKAAYPLTTCVVSGDVLEDGPMGPPVDYIYKQEGKPDRLVRFCCDHCISKFNKDPEKYLKMIDDAAAAKAKAQSPATQPPAPHHLK